MGLIVFLLILISFSVGVASTLVLHIIISAGALA